MASLTFPQPLSRRIALGGLLALFACVLMGMAKKTEVTVRFFEEANAMDTDKFARVITFKHPPRKGYISSIPAVHEGMFKAVYPFQAADNTWGCTFFLDAKGQMDLDVVSTSHKGGTLVAFLSTKTGTHQAAELLIDQRITDGIITIPSGLTDLEIEAIKQNWPVVGVKKKK
jgi:hypothetical protein